MHADQAQKIMPTMNKLPKKHIHAYKIILVVGGWIGVGEAIPQNKK
jgi:hypothetical protein